MFEIKSESTYRVDFYGFKYPKAFQTDKNGNYMYEKDEEGNNDYNKPIWIEGCEGLDFKYLYDHNSIVKNEVEEALNDRITINYPRNNSDLGVQFCHSWVKDTVNLLLYKKDPKYGITFKAMQTLLHEEGYYPPNEKIEEWVEQITMTLDGLEDLFDCQWEDGCDELVMGW